MFKNASISSRQRGLSAKQSKAGCLEVLPSIRILRYASLLRKHAAQGA